MKDFVLLLHPAIAIFTIFPLLGIITQLALNIRKRRLEATKAIPATVGRDHTQIGKLLTGAVVGIVLLALANDIGNNLMNSRDPVKVGWIGLLFGSAIAALVFLYRAKNRLWRAVWATLCGASLVILGCQDGVYRNTEHWYISHYYYGITVALLMIFALAILPDIYRDKRWRTVHTVLNCFALLLFLGQSMTGVRSLLEIPLHWQEPYVQQLYEQHCETRACNVQPK